MAWLGIHGHDHTVEQFRRSLGRGRLATTFLFIGPEGIGKRLFAMRLAQSMLCEAVPEERLAPCGNCPACRQVSSGTHPDLLVITKPEDKAFIPVETFIGDRDHRMRAGLCHDISLTPSGGKRRFAIIDDADYLNQEGANCLLKTLEEPPPRAVIILIGTSEQRQLPTIRSRSQIVRFRPLSQENIAHCLVESGMAESPQAAATMASRADGSVSRARILAEENLAEFRQRLWRLLACSAPDRQSLTNVLSEFVDSAGKDVPARRRHLRLALDATIDFYRALLHRLLEMDEADDVALKTAISDCSWWTGGIEAIASLLERSLEALRHVDANANLASLIEGWGNEMTNTARTGQPMLSRRY